MNIGTDVHDEGTRMNIVLMNSFKHKPDQIVHEKSSPTIPQLSDGSMQISKVTVSDE